MAQAAPTTVATPTAQANSALSTSPLTPFQQAQGGAGAFQFANGQGFNANGQVVSGPVNTSSPLPVSTTTLSSGNKAGQVAGIQSTTDNFANTGSTANGDGSITHSNGTTTPPTLAPAPNPNPAPNPASTTTGGYIGDQYYPPNSILPTDSTGQPQATTPTSTTDDQIMKSLNDQLVKTDSMTASIIQNIQSQYDQLITKQKETNAGQEASVSNALLKGGVTGSGSSSQYAPISSAGIIQAQVSYGISQIADLQSKENSAIIAAQQAGQNADFQLQNKINDQISKIRDEKVAAATKLNDTIATQNKKMADDKIQQTKDTAVADLVAKGITDPAKILDTLTKQGLTIDSTEINTALKNIDPGKATIQTIATDAAKAGASADTVKAILASADPSAALQLATPSMGAKAQATLNAKLFTPPTAKQLGGAQFYKYPSSSVVYSSKGQQLDLETYKQLTNQTDKPDSEVDFNPVKTINPTSTTSTPATKTTPAQLKVIHNKNDQALASVAGTDNHVSPDDFNHAADLFVQNGAGTYQQFYAAHKAFTNPSDVKAGKIKGT